VTLAYVSGEGSSYLPLWAVIPMIAAIAIIAGIGLWATMRELNPDPGWRARAAEIRRLEQEQRLRELRGDGG
jgi:hypothetical protein